MIQVSNDEGFLVPHFPSVQDLVIRFLKRATSNLQQDVQVAFPSRQLPLQDRRRMLSHQLGEFIRCYDQVSGFPAKQQFWDVMGRRETLVLSCCLQETDDIVKKQVSERGNCVHSGVFQEYIAAARLVGGTNVLLTAPPCNERSQSHVTLFNSTVKASWRKC